VNKVRRELAGGRYFVEAQYETSADHVCGLKLAIVVHDRHSRRNVLKFDNAHKMKEGAWPPHRHLDPGRHYYWSSPMQSSGPGFLFREGMAVVLTEINSEPQLDEATRTEIAAALASIWLEVRGKEMWA